MRRWVGIAGILVAVTAGTAASARELSEAEFEAEVSLRVPRAEAVHLPHGPERLFDTPGVSERVRLRLGGLPPVRVTAMTDDTVLVRSRGTTPWQATDGAETYAESYVDVRRRQIVADAGAATEDVRFMVVQVESQLLSADEPQRAALLAELHRYKEQLDRLQLDLYGPQVLGSAPARPVADGARVPWIIAALGATVGAGGAVAAHRTGRRTHAETGAVANEP